MVAMLLGVTLAVVPTTAAADDRVDAFHLEVIPSNEVLLGSGSVVFAADRTCYDWEGVEGTGIVVVAGWRDRGAGDGDPDVSIHQQTEPDEQWRIEWTPGAAGRYEFVAVCVLYGDMTGEAWYQGTLTSVVVIDPAAPGTGASGGTATSGMKGKAKKFVKTGAAVDCSNAILKGRFKKKARQVRKAVFKATTADGLSKKLKTFKAKKIKPGKKFKLKGTPAATRTVKVKLKLTKGKKKGKRSYHPCA